MTLFHFLWSLSFALPSWTTLESQLPLVSPPPVFKNKLPEAFHLQQSQSLLVLYRDEQGLCPYSQQVWLALEIKGIDYVTVLISGETTTHSTTTTTTTPRLQWPDGTVQTESLDILQRIQDSFPDTAPDLYRRISKAVDNVRCNIVRFKGVFPRNTMASLQAPYLFRENGVLVPVQDHMVTLEEIDEVLEEYDDGPFLCGSFVSAADIVWAPFLERYAAQLPLLHGGDALVPRSKAYVALLEWYDAMEELVPCYACRVAGDRATWTKVLTQAIHGGHVPPVDVLLPPSGNLIPTNRKKLNAQSIWKQYIEQRPWMAQTPEEELVAFIVRNCDSIGIDVAATLQRSEQDVDVALREVVAALLDHTLVDELSEAAIRVGAAVEDKLMVPRDVGVLPAATLRTLMARVSHTVDRKVLE
jgi:glutathione S-transferase